MAPSETIPYSYLDGITEQYGEWTGDRSRAEKAGADALDAVSMGGGMYAHYADETSAWYLVDADDMVTLGAALLDGRDLSDVYSRWCAETGSEEVDGTDHATLDRIAHTGRTVTYRCQCGEATGERCAWSGPRDQMATVDWMPEHLRESHRAAGNAGAYPHNGALRLRVHPDCAELLADDPESED